MHKLTKVFVFFFCFIFLLSCQVPTTVKIKNITFYDAQGILLDYIFLNGYEIIDRNDQRGLYLVFVDSQHVSEYEVVSDTQQVQDSSQYGTDIFVGPPLIYYPGFTHQDSTRNITQIHKKNTVKHRQIVEEHKEQFSIKISSVGDDVQIVLNAISEIELNPAFYLNALTSFYEKQGYIVELDHN